MGGGRIGRGSFLLSLILSLVLCFGTTAQASGGLDSLTLYANWKTHITFDANGGTLSGGTTAEEKSLVGQAAGTLSVNVNQPVSTGLYGTRNGFSYVTWNTRPDGTGTDLANYGKITGPVTFYAIYYQSDYGYTGTEQVFVVPVNGTYRITLHGASGGSAGLRKDVAGMSNTSGYPSKNIGIGGKGSSVAGSVHLTAGTKLYVYVGEGGSCNTDFRRGFNGGGGSVSGSYAPYHQYRGGGATDIRTIGGAWDDSAGLGSRIMVAGGGGGSAYYSGAGGGSSYVSVDERPHVSGITFFDVTGSRGSSQSGKGGRDGFLQIICVERD